MKLIEHILDRKGHHVWTVGPDDTVLHALEEMARRDIGAVVVVENKRLVGLLTERLYARNVFLKGRASPTTRIRDVMNADPIVVSPKHRIDEGMAIMTEKRVQYLPVLDKGQIVGIVSIGDLLKTVLANTAFDVEQLVAYIGQPR
ncbi:MAG: CBS domain-containing protein [Alphaproteobacteria bacterium]